MGDEQKIKNIMNEINDIMKLIEDGLEIAPDLSAELNERYGRIRDFYKDFMDNYLDFIEISDNLYDGIYISDGTGKTLFINKAYSKLTGITKEEIVGRTVKDISEEGKLYKGAVTMDVIERKEVVNSLGKGLKTNIDLLVTGTPIFDEEGNVRLVVINDRDISGLKDLEIKIAELQEHKMRASEEIKYLRNQQTTSNTVIYDSENMKTLMELRTCACAG
jgi:PAS domain S-box-containing protein